MTERTPLARLLIRWVRAVVAICVAVPVIAYVGDWTVFRLRGRPVDQVVVNEYLATPLKGNNTEVDFEGTAPVACARALFPQGGSEPCWYLRKHATQFERPY